MKVIALFMIIWMSLVSMLTGTVQAMQYGKESKCCMQSSLACTCKLHKSDKAIGMCLNKLCCNVPGFTINKTVQILPAAPIEIKNCLVNLVLENTIDFSFSFWHPPKGVLL
jgi:hypothetical protein